MPPIASTNGPAPPNGQAAPGGPLNLPPVDVRRNYIAGGTNPLAISLPQVLSHYIDDAQKEYGDKLYEVMMTDPKIGSSISLLKQAVLSEGVTLTPTRQPAARDQAKKKLEALKAGTEPPPEDPDTVKAREIRDFCQRCLDRLDRPFESYLYEMLDALPFGSKLSEKIYEPAADGPDRGKIVLKSLRVKPRRAWAFVVDAYANVLAILGAVPPRTDGASTPAPGTSVPGTPAPPLVGGLGGFASGMLLPRDKFAILSWDLHDGDPRGRSVLRGAYDHWLLKRQVTREYRRYLNKCATPTTVGTTAPNDQPRPAVDASGREVAGQPLLTPEQWLGQQLERLENGSTLALPAGSKVYTLAVGGSAGVFEGAFDYLDRQIVSAILEQTRATMEALHGSKADSQTSQDMFGLFVQWVRRWVEYFITDEILAPLVLISYGKYESDHLLPSVSLGTQSREDRAAVLTSLAQLGYRLDPSQFPEIDAENGLPERDLEAPAPTPTPVPLTAAIPAAVGAPPVPVGGAGGGPAGRRAA